MSMCGKCKFFVVDNTCQLVEGEIKESDTCDLFQVGEPKSDININPIYDKSEVNYRHAELSSCNMPHYHGAIENPNIEFLDNYKGLKGSFIKKFLISDKFNINKWRVTWESILLDVKGFIGQPLVLTPSRDHPSVKNQESFKVGEIIDVIIDEMNHTVYQVSHITKPGIAELIHEKKIRFGSPTVVVYSEETREIRNRGTASEEHVLHRFKPGHDALVAEPAYGKEVDKIKAICDGTGIGCAMKLSQVDASVKEGVLGDSTISQLTIVGFVRKALNKKFKPETLKAIVEYAQNSNAKDSCISRKIKIISDEDPSRPHDQIIAMAYSYCEKSGSLEGALGGDVVDKILGEKQRIRDEMKVIQAVEVLQDKLEKYHS